MNFFNAILIGLKEVWAHKFRSILTMLGIILGVASLVAMAAIIKGMANGMRETMIAMGGADKFLLQDQDVPTYQDYLADEAPGRTMRDVYALKNCAPLIKLISPEMAISHAILTRGKNRTRASECVGVWPAVLKMNLHTLQYGRFFTPIDEEDARPVCVIGTGIRDDLFGAPDEIGKTIIPLGKTININHQPFVIVGMFEHYESERDRKREEQQKEQQKSKGTNKPAGSRPRTGHHHHHGGWAFWRKNQTVYMPMNTAWLRFRAATGTNNVPDPHLTDIDMKVADLNLLLPALQQVRNVLMITHHGIEDFNFRTQENQIDNINTQIKNARLSGGFIAGISLLVGGIGIMNIMLASINERIREIGICKAIGATAFAIFLQILIESLVIAMIGALMGLVASYGLVQILAVVSPMGNTPVITPLAMIVAILFSAAVGIVAGMFPALKAAKLNPIQALRFE